MFLLCKASQAGQSTINRKGPSSIPFRIDRYYRSAQQLSSKLRKAYEKSNKMTMLCDFIGDNCNPGMEVIF